MGPQSSTAIKKMGLGFEEDLDLKKTSPDKVFFANFPTLSLKEEEIQVVHLKN